MATIKPDLTRVWANGAPPGNVVDPDTTTPGKVNAGWQAEVPPFEHFNFLQRWFTQGLAHFNEQGIGVWDTDTDYPVGGLAKGSDGRVYTCLNDQSSNDPVSDTGINWAPILSGLEGYTKLSKFSGMYDGMSVELKYRSLEGDLGGGIFYWDSSDLSAEVSNDPQQGVYLAPDSDPTGTNGSWVRRNTSIINIESYGVNTDNSDNSIALSSALSSGYNLEGNGKEYNLQSPITGISINSIVNNLELIWDGDEDVILGFSGDAKFINCKAIELSRSGKSNQNRIFQSSESALFLNCHTDGFSTAFDSLQGDNFSVINCSSRNIRGFSPQLGYGINSSAIITFVLNYEYSAESGNNGRHAVYINGPQVKSFSIRDIKVDGCYLNPINVRITDTDNEIFGFIDNIDFRNVFTATDEDEPNLSAAINISNPDSMAVNGCVKISNVIADTFVGGLIRILGYPGSSINDITIRNASPGTNNVHIISLIESNYSSVSNISIMNSALNSNGNLVNINDSVSVTVSDNSGSVSSGRSAVRLGSGCSECTVNNTDVSGFTNDYEDADAEGVNSITVRGFTVTPFIDKSGESTPDVKYIERVLFVESSNLNVTNFLNGIDGQLLIVLAQTANVTIKAGSNIETKSGGDVVMGQRDTFQCVKRGGRWQEV